MPNDEIFVFEPSKILDFLAVGWMSNDEVRKGITQRGNTSPII
jgi:hypothetical protein